MDNSGDYISREAAIELLKMALDDDWEPEYAADRLSEIPSADVRSVVLCRDCKYWFNAPVADGFNSCELDALIRHEDFFCAAGEKREES